MSSVLLFAELSVILILVFLIVLIMLLMLRPGVPGDAPSGVPGDATSGVPADATSGVPADATSGVPADATSGKLLPDARSACTFRNGTCPIDVSHCSDLKQRPIQDGMSAEEDWVDLPTKLKSDNFWTLDPSAIKDGGTGYATCWGSWRKGTRGNPLGAKTGGAQWRRNPNGFAINDVRIWGFPGEGNGGKCPWIASREAFTFGKKPGQVYSIEMDVRIYGGGKSWYAVWTDPLCFAYIDSKSKCNEHHLDDQGIGPHQNEIDQVEGYGKRLNSINFNTCAGSILVEDSTCTETTSKVSCGGTTWNGERQLLDHHVTVRFLEEDSADQKYPATPELPNGKVQVSYCDRSQTQGESTVLHEFCTCLATSDNSNATIGPRGYADNLYKLVVDIWGNQGSADAPEMVLEVTNVALYDARGCYAQGIPFDGTSLTDPTFPAAGDTPGSGPCRLYFDKYKDFCGDWMPDI